MFEFFLLFVGGCVAVIGLMVFWNGDDGPPPPRLSDRLKHVRSALDLDEKDAK